MNCSVCGAAARVETVCGRWGAPLVPAIDWLHWEDLFTEQWGENELLKEQNAKLREALARLLATTRVGNEATHELGCGCVIHEALAAIGTSKPPRPVKQHIPGRHGATVGTSDELRAAPTPISAVSAPTTEEDAADE